MTGMLWFDQDPKTSLEQKIVKALQHHAKRFGRKAEIVAISVKDADGVNIDQLSSTLKVTIRARRWCMPSHMIVGFEDQKLELA